MLFRGRTVLYLLLIAFTCRWTYWRLVDLLYPGNKASEPDMNARVTYPIVIVGSGLAGLSTSVQLVKNKVPIVLLDKASSIGGNSVKASSGINGAGTVTQQGLKVKDSHDLFYKDTYRSARGGGAPELMEKLAVDSADAIGWLQNEFGIKLDTLSQLGGHSVARTHRSSGKLPPGFEIVSKLRKSLEGSDPELVQIKLGARVVDVGLESGRVKSLSYVDTEGTQHEMRTNNVVFCTGGFSYSAELLAHHAPGLEVLPTTNGEQTTGDGQKLLQKLGGQLIDMEQVQVHPTGFVDSEDRLNKNKILAAEALRGNGAILLNPLTGRRFVNELDTRDAVTTKIQEACKDSIAYLVMSEAIYSSMSSHLDFYLFKKLIHKAAVAELAAVLRKKTEDIIRELVTYSSSGTDAFGRTHKINTFGTSVKPETEIYYGEITPVVHFTMGGARINKRSEVLNEKGEVLANGLYAAGEVSGGVHGANRLGGSSLLECVVYGRQAANSILESLE